MAPIKNTMASAVMTVAVVAALLSPSWSVSASRGHDGPKHDKSNKGCAVVFHKLCEDPCRNNSTENDVVGKYDCSLNCYNENIASGAIPSTCPAPVLSPADYKKANCSDILQIQCENCTNVGGLDKLACANNCVHKHGLHGCQHGKPDFPGSSDLNDNCTAVLKQECADCFKPMKMDDKVKCLADCAQIDAVSAACPPIWRQDHGGDHQHPNNTDTHHNDNGHPPMDGRLNNTRTHSPAPPKGGDGKGKGKGNSGGGSDNNGHHL